ncbi:YqaJ viral recombinase family nuclease [Bartonella sp. B17]
MKRLLKLTSYPDAANWFGFDNEDEWLENRAHHITATASSALFGVSPYMTEFDLYHQLAGNVSPKFVENERMLWGKRLQKSIAQGICDDNGWRLVSDHPFLYAESVAHPRIGCSPDYIIWDDKNPERGYGCLEIKNVDNFIAYQQWEDEEAPAHVEFQLQHQMGVCGFSWGVIGGLIGENEARVLIREADKEAIEAIFSACNAMFTRVKIGNPPLADYLADYDTIRNIYRHSEKGSSIDLDAPIQNIDVDEIEILIAKKYQADTALKLAKNEQKRANAALLNAIEDTETVIGRGWKVSAPTISKAAYTVNYPETTYRHLRVSKLKEKGISS